MKIELTYAQVFKKHHKQINKLVKILRNSKSKHHNSDIKKLKFYYITATHIESCSFFNDFISGKSKEDYKRKNSMTIDELVAEQVSRTTSSLMAKIERWRGEIVLDNVPQEIVYLIRQNFIDRKAEQDRYNNLSKEEQNKELQETLNYLRKDSGFMEFKL